MKQSSFWAHNTPKDWDENVSALGMGRPACPGHCSVVLLFVPTGVDLSPELSHGSSCFIRNTLHTRICTGT